MPAIHHALLIGAPVENVYTALCSQEGLSAWWTPGTKATAEMNTVARFPFGADYFKEMKVIELKPNELVKWNCISGADEWIGTTISFKLLFGDNGTFLKSHPEMNGQIEQQENDKATL
jgi:uncharacterized protein YndB with AHSA1/START domain